MGKRLRKYLVIFVIMCIVGNIINIKSSFAASSKVELSSSLSEVQVGDTIAVYITITSGSLIGDFEASLTYNDSLLEYQGGSSAISGGGGFLRVSDMGVTEGDVSRKYVIKFEALQPGISEIAFSGKTMVYDLDTGLEMSVSSNVLNIKISAKESASSNTSLKSLKINPAELTPAFDKNIFEYNTTVAYDTKRLIINALPEDSKATVSVSGNDDLKEGENKVIVSVIAQSGAVIEYTINVVKDNTPVTPPVSEITKIPQIPSQSVFEVVRMNDANYIIYSGKYQLIDITDETLIPAGYLKTKLIISGISIPAFYPEGKMDSEFLLIYAMNELGEKAFYQYDKVEKTLQRYVVKKAVIPDTANDPTLQDDDQINKYHANLTKAAITIALLSALSAALVLIIIRLFFKLKGYKEDDLE